MTAWIKISILKVSGMSCMVPQKSISAPVVNFKSSRNKEVFT